MRSLIGCILLLLIASSCASDCVRISASPSCGGCSLSEVEICEGDPCTRVTTCPGTSIWATVESISGDTVSGFMYADSTCTRGMSTTLECDTCNTRSGWTFEVGCPISTLTISMTPVQSGSGDEGEDDLPVGWIVFGSLSGFIVLLCCCCCLIGLCAVVGCVVYQRQGYTQL